MGTDSNVRDDRAQVVYSAVWHPMPYRVVVGDTPLAHGDEPGPLRDLAARFNSRLTASVLERGGVRG